MLAPMHVMLLSCYRKLCQGMLWNLVLMGIVQTPAQPLKLKLKPTEKHISPKMLLVSSFQPSFMTWFMARFAGNMLLQFIRSSPQQMFHHI